MPWARHRAPGRKHRGRVPAPGQIHRLGKAYRQGDEEIVDGVLCLEAGADGAAVDGSARHWLDVGSDGLCYCLVACHHADEVALLGWNFAATDGHLDESTTCAADLLAQVTAEPDRDGAEVDQGFVPERVSQIVGKDGSDGFFVEKHREDDIGLADDLRWRWGDFGSGLH